MSEQDTSRATRPLYTERPTNEQPDEHPRGDDRNEELDESPVPDPEAKNPDAEDDPGAD